MTPQRRYTEIEPARPLRGLVACYWRFWVVGGEPGEALSHPIPPDGGASISVRLDDGTYVGAALAGPQKGPQIARVLPESAYWGVRLWPGVAAPAFGLGARTLVNAEVDLADADPELERTLAELPWGSDPGQLVSELDRVVAGRLVDVEVDPVVMAAVASILESRGAVAIADLVAASGLSERQFQRRFGRAVGMTPKQLVRVRRIRGAAIAALERDAPLGDLAHEAGFADQAHMVREFRHLIGQPPGTFRARIREIAHGNYER